MIHIELKNKEHSYMDAYRQIKKYIAEGKFRGLFSNVQMFVVSNAVDTKYFSAAKDTELKHQFITGWLDKENQPVCDYIEFAKEVLKIPMAHEMVTKYTVLDNDKRKLLILRPYLDMDIYLATFPNQPFPGIVKRSVRYVILNF